MEPILVSREIASDTWKLYKELKRRGIEVGKGSRFKFFSIQPDPEDPELFWVTESKSINGSIRVNKKEQENDPQMLN